MYKNSEYDQLSSTLKNDDHMYRAITEFNLGAIHADAYKLDTKVSHILNSNGFRGPEFGLVDLLAAGCSQTYGMGIEEKDSWPALLNKKLNMSYANIAVPGISIQKIVESVILYIKKYGNPKVVCVVLPSLYRVSFVLRGDTLVFPYGGNSGFSAPDDYISLQNVTMTPTGTVLDENKSRPNFSRRPHDITKVLPYESVLYLNMMAINYLIEYCNLAKIKLLITTWYEDTDKFMLEKSKRSWELDMSGYFSPGDLNNFYYQSELSTCHNHEGKPEYWHKGLDKSRHMGAHSHLHFAELFAKEISKNGK